MDAPCLAYGFLISLVVSWLKRFTFIANHPKLIVAAAAGLVPVAGAIAQAVGHPLPVGFSADTGTIAKCIATTFASAVATHEAITQPVASTFLPSSDK